MFTEMQNYFLNDVFFIFSVEFLFPLQEAFSGVIISGIHV